MTVPDGNEYLSGIDALSVKNQPVRSIKVEP